MKNQLKKSLSLLMAVLMILSCWVWVAPEKAEAVQTPYQLRVRVQNNNAAGENGGKASIVIGYRETNGYDTGNIKKKEVDLTSVMNASTEGGNDVFLDFAVPGFPVSVQLGAYATGVGKGSDSVKGTLNGVFIMKGDEAYQIWGVNPNIAGSEDNMYSADNGYLSLSANSWKYSTEAKMGDGLEGSRDWILPYFDTLTEISEAKATVNKLDNGDPVTTSVRITGGIDQYGVDYRHTFPVSGYTYDLYYMENGKKKYFKDSSYKSYATVEADSYASTATVTLSDDIQTLFPDSRDGEIYIEASYKTGDDAEKVSAPITLTFPKYTASFYPNGGTIGSSSAETYTGDTPYVKKGNLFYGSVIGNAPKYSKLDGYELDGYYSVKNPLSTGLDVKFSGIRFDPESTLVGLNGDSKWYAAWKAKTYKAYFRVGTNLLGVLDAKHGKSMLGEGMYESVLAINNMLAEEYKGDAIDFEETVNLGTTPTLNDQVFKGWRIMKSDGSLSDLRYAAITGDVTFEAIFEPREVAEKKYTITFYNGETDDDGKPVIAEDAEGNKYQNEYYFRDLATNVPNNDESEILKKEADEKYTYKFAGWAKYIGKPFYAVDDNGKDDAGAYIPYMPAATAEFVVTEDAEYVPVFKMTKVPYDVEFSYKINNGERATNTKMIVPGYHFGDNVIVPEEIKNNYTKDGKRYTLTGWMHNSELVDFKTFEVTGYTKLDAYYGEVDDATYTINFWGKDTDGETDILLNEGATQYDHGDTVTAPAFDDVFADVIETATSRYKFIGWSPEVKQQAKADVDYRAIYEKKDYATVTFINEDGTPIYTPESNENNKKFFVGQTVPVYDEEIQGVPQKAEDEKGTYEWIGWKDQAGNRVIPGTSLITGDMILTADYEKTAKTYSVQFLNGDEVIGGKQILEYGEEVDIPDASEVIKESDDHYKYTFWKWSPTVSDKCYGDVTYVAEFRQTPIYYTVHWLNDSRQPYKTSRVAFEKKIQQVTTPETTLLGDAPEGYEWVLKNWVLCDEAGDAILDDNGDRIHFFRGMTMDKKDIYFYPEYEAKAGLHAVSFQDSTGSIIKTLKIGYNEAVEDYTDEIFEILYDTTHIDTLYEINNASKDKVHFEFDKWIVVSENAEELEVNADGRQIITKPVTLKASFVPKDHTLELGDIIQEATCMAAGSVDAKCSYEYCDYREESTIDIIVDDNAPSGQVYIGTDNWTSEEFNANPKAIDYADIVYVNANSSTIASAVDNGTRSKPHNVDARLSRGVGKIDFAVVDVTNYKNAEQIAEFDPEDKISNWKTIYDYNMVRLEVLDTVLKDYGIKSEDYIKPDFEVADDIRTEVENEVEAVLATYRANATGMLGELGLIDGGKYVIFIRLSDKEIDGDVNITYMSTGTLHYGTQAANITVSGDGYGSKFCEEATVRITDDTDGFEVYLDDEKLNISATSTSATGASAASFDCKETGVHTITVIDKNGNRSSKIFEIENGHTFRNFTVAENCENDGFTYDVCDVCGKRANVIVRPALTHKFESIYIEEAPTCTGDGCRIYTCENNCGETFTVEPTSDAAVFEMAKVLDQETEEWRNLTPDDIKHLKATNKHIYAKEVDKDGKPTSNDVWIIDKAPTCETEGSKHKSCTVCGFELIDTIAPDTENGHRFYRARVQKGDEATCTKAGIKSKICRYCGKKVKVDEIAALGHTVGKYVVIKPATCTEAGSKILTCAVCTDAAGNPTRIGEPIKDSTGKITGFDNQAIEIKKTGHSYDASIPVQNDEGKWVVTYTCSACGYNYTEIDEYYVPPVSYTATFIVDDNDTDPLVITKLKGGTISAANITKVPTKDADKTYKYTFSHWATRTGEGTEDSPYVYTAVEFPLEVKSDAIYYAQFAEKNIKYTITYNNEETVVVENNDGTIEYTNEAQLSQFKKVGYINNLTEITLEAGPVKAATALYEYNFAGWAIKTEEKVTEEKEYDDGTSETIEKTVASYTPVGDKVTINGANVILYATYTRQARIYAVTYAESLQETIETFEVKAGTRARRCAIEPEKIADSKYHYSFKGWNRAEQLAYVTGNIYTTPDFEAKEHTFTFITVSPATCTANKKEKKVCACGYETEVVEVANTALNHLWSNNSEYNQATGEVVRKCQRVGCDATTADTRTFTFDFYKEEPADENARPYIDVPNIAWGTKVDASRLPAAPEKDADDQYIYTFKGWKLKGDATDTIVDIEKLEVKQDYDFVAVFDKAVREYTVTFAYEYSHKPIKVYTVKYGQPVVFDGTTPVKEKDTDPNYDPDNYHYTFKGWSVDTDKITANTMVYAKFTKAEHTYGTAVETGPATCQQGTGYKYTCTLDTCKHVKYETGKPLAHKLEIIENVAATPDKDGYIKRQCAYEYDGKRCEYTETEILKYEDSTVRVIVTVDRDGKPASNIKVLTHAIGEDATMDASTNVNGIATIVVEKDKTYVAYVEIDGNKIPVTLVADSNGNFIGVYSIITNNNGNSGDADCGCACHRNNFWGTIFRFFHKIIKLFTGEFKCCGNPDPMYG